MELDQELVNILRCPETGQSLRLATPEILSGLNAKIGRGDLYNRGGVLVTQPLRQCLIREDNRLAYPVFGQVSLMLSRLAVEL